LGPIPSSGRGEGTSADPRAASSAEEDHRGDPPIGSRRAEEEEDHRRHEGKDPIRGDPWRVPEEEGLAEGRTPTLSRRCCSGS